MESRTTPVSSWPLRRSQGDPLALLDRNDGLDRIRGCDRDALGRGMPDCQTENHGDEQTDAISSVGR